MLAFAVDDGLLVPRNSCADGSACPNLLLADAVLWALCVCFFGFSVMGSWETYILIAGVTDQSLVTFYFDYAKYISRPTNAFAAGMNFLPPALATRTMTLFHGHEAYPAYTAWITVGLLTIWWILMWFYWLYAMLFLTPT